MIELYLVLHGFPIFSPVNFGHPLWFQMRCCCRSGKSRGTLLLGGWSVFFMKYISRSLLIWNGYRQYKSFRNNWKAPLKESKNFSCLSCITFVYWIKNKTLCPHHQCNRKPSPYISHYALSYLQVCYSSGEDSSIILSKIVNICSSPRKEKNSKPPTGKM